MIKEEAEKCHEIYLNECLRILRRGLTTGEIIRDAPRGVIENVAALKAHYDKSKGVVTIDVATFTAEIEALLANPVIEWQKNGPIQRVNQADVPETGDKSARSESETEPDNALTILFSRDRAYEDYLATHCARVLQVSFKQAADMVKKGEASIAMYPHQASALAHIPGMLVTGFEPSHFVMVEETLNRKTADYCVRAIAENISTPWEVGQLMRLPGIPVVYQGSMAQCSAIAEQLNGALASYGETRTNMFVVKERSPVA